MAIRFHTSTGVHQFKKQYSQASIYNPNAPIALSSDNPNYAFHLPPPHTVKPTLQRHTNYNSMNKIEHSPLRDLSTTIDSSLPETSLAFNKTNNDVTHNPHISSLEMPIKENDNNDDDKDDVINIESKYSFSIEPLTTKDVYLFQNPPATTTATINKNKNKNHLQVHTNHLQNSKNKTNGHHRSYSHSVVSTLSGSIRSKLNESDDELLSAKFQLHYGHVNQRNNGSMLETVGSIPGTPLPGNHVRSASSPRSTRMIHLTKHEEPTNKLNDTHPIPAAVVASVATTLITSPPNPLSETGITNSSSIAPLPGIASDSSSSNQAGTTRFIPDSIPAPARNPKKKYSSIFTFQIPNQKKENESNVYPETDGDNTVRTMIRDNSHSSRSSRNNFDVENRSNKKKTQKLVLNTKKEFPNSKQNKKTFFEKYFLCCAANEESKPSRNFTNKLHIKP